MLMHHSALTVFLFWSGVVVTWPDLAKETAFILLVVLLDILNFKGGHSSGKRQTVDCCLVAGSY